MPKTLRNLTLLVLLALLALPGATRQARAQTQAPAPTPTALYPAKAPLDQYMMPTQASEIELARSAAPASIADGAEILVLTPTGYVTAVPGTNGFICVVERSWAKDTGDAEFWNPKMRAPTCFNAAAAKTYLPVFLLKTRLVLAGKSRPEITAAVKSAFDKKEFPTLAPNAMCYMMSAQQYLSDDDKHWHPHMMWFVAGDAAQSWQANLAGVPAIAGYVPEDHLTVFLLKVDHWSDGTPAAH